MFTQSQQVSPDLNTKLHSLNHQIRDLHTQIREAIPQIDRISFILYDTHLDMLRTYAASEITEVSSDDYQQYYFSECAQLKEAAELNTSHVIESMAELTLAPQPQHTKWLLDQGYQSTYFVPSYHHQQFIGFISFNSFKPHVFNIEVQQLLQPFCEEISHTINTEYSVINAILSSAALAREVYPGSKQDSDKHISRVSLFTHLIAKNLAYTQCFGDEMVEYIHLFSRLHDIGKLTIPDAILLKPTSLTPDERKIMQSHIDKGLIIIEKILADLGSPKHACIETLIDIITHHHEFLDGSGYPNGLSGDEIPISARIVAVANVFDALTSHRPYQQAWCVTSALLELEKMVAMGKLDGHCVNVLRDHQEYINQILSQYPEQDPRESLFRH